MADNIAMPYIITMTIIVALDHRQMLNWQKFHTRSDLDNAVFLALIDAEGEFTHPPFPLDSRRSKFDFSHHQSYFKDPSVNFPLQRWKGQKYQQFRRSIVDIVGDNLEKEVDKFFLKQKSKKYDEDSLSVNVVTEYLIKHLVKVADIPKNLSKALATSNLYP